MLDLPSDLLSNIGPTFTASAWVYLDGPPTLRQSIFEVVSVLDFTGFTGVYHEPEGIVLYLNNERNYNLTVREPHHFCNPVAYSTNRSS